MQHLTGTIETMDDFPIQNQPLIAPIVPEITTQSLVDLLPRILKEDGTQLVTREQAVELTNLRFSKSQLQILTLLDRHFVYEIVNMLNVLEYELVLGFLSVDWEKAFGQQGRIRDKILFAGPMMQQAKEKLAMDMEIYRGTTDVVVGAVDCRKCGSKETLSVAKQNRGADEAITVRITCLMCRHKWTAQ